MEFMSDSPPRTRLRLALAILALFFSWTAYIVIQHPEHFSPLLSVPLPFFFWLVVITLGQVMLAGIFLRDVLRAKGMKMSATECIALPLVSSFLNFVLPVRGGTGFRALYVYVNHAFPIADFVASTLVYSVLYIGIHGIGGCVSLVLLAAGYRENSGVLLFIFIASAITPAAMIWLFHGLAPAAGRRFAAITRVSDALTDFRRNRGLFLRSTANVLLLVIFTFLQYMTAFAACGIDIQIVDVVFFICARNLAMLIGLTPGSIGTVEILMIIVGQFLSISMYDVLLVQALIRAVTFSVLIVSFPISLRFLNLSLDGLSRLLKKNGEART